MTLFSFFDEVVHSSPSFVPEIVGRHSTLLWFACLCVLFVSVRVLTGRSKRRQLARSMLLSCPAPGRDCVVAFDLHGVVLTLDLASLVLALLGQPGKLLSLFLCLLSPSIWPSVLSRSHPEVFEHAVRNLALRHPALRGHIDFLLDLQNCQRAIPGTIQIIRELKARGVPCYVLSNIGCEPFRRIQAQMPEVFGLFDGAVVAERDKGFLAKPDQAIYAEFHARLAKGRKVVFVDDKWVNLVPAFRAGMIGVLFTGAFELRRDLAALGVL